MTRATIPATAIDEAAAAALPSMLQNFLALSLTLGLKRGPHDVRHNDIWRNDTQHIDIKHYDTQHMDKE